MFRKFTKTRKKPWHRKSTYKAQFWHFDEMSFIIFIECSGFLWLCWFLAKSLAFRTHYLWNSTTQLTWNYRVLVWTFRLKWLKVIEVIVESYPQFTISLFIMQSLQIREPMNIFSCVVSGFSIVYGLGNYLALDIYGNPEYPFSMVIFGGLSIFTDTILRTLALSYWMSISKGQLISKVSFVMISFTNKCQCILSMHQFSGMSKESIPLIKVFITDDVMNDIFWN